MKISNISILVIYVLFFCLWHGTLSMAKEEEAVPEDYEIEYNESEDAIAQAKVSDQDDYNLTVGANARFQTINEAIAYAKLYATKSHRVNIYIETGIYNESIDLRDDQGIDLIGAGVGKTVVSAKAQYPFAPIYASGTMQVTGITFHAQSGSNSYAFHYEINNDEVEGHTVFRDCEFISDGTNACVGAGLGENCTLELSNCIMRSNTNYGLYFHNNVRSNTLNQKIIISNCQIDAGNDGVAIMIDDAASIYGSKNSIITIDINNTRSTYHKIIFRKKSNNVYGYIPADDENFMLSMNQGMEDLPGLQYRENRDIKISASGLYVANSDSKSYTVGMVCDTSVGADVEYSWYVSYNGGEYKLIQNWAVNNEWVKWFPESFGDYTLLCRARVVGYEYRTVEVKQEIQFHPYIKGVCQMPYTGEGNGYLMGLESYENPNQSYQYEMLILDCTLLAQGKPAWIYTTGKCSVPEKSFWTVWQPRYGYYWTLFRVYDEKGNLLDEVCYGFENI